MVWGLEQVDLALAEVEGRDHERYATLPQDPVTEDTPKQSHETIRPVLRTHELSS